MWCLGWENYLSPLPRTRLQGSTLRIREIYDLLSFDFVSLFLMALVVIPFKFVRRLALQEYLIDVRHSSMSTMRRSGISLTAHRKKSTKKERKEKSA